MTCSINKETYAVLLVQYQPKVIETEEENEAAIALAEYLVRRQRSPEEDTLLKVLVS